VVAEDQQVVYEDGKAPEGIDAEVKVIDANYNE
jgi:hypothetical protein